MKACIHNGRYKITATVCSTNALSSCVYDRHDSEVAPTILSLGSSLLLSTDPVYSSPPVSCSLFALFLSFLKIGHGHFALLRLAKGGGGGKQIFIQIAK